MIHTENQLRGDGSIDKVQSIILTLNLALSCIKLKTSKLVRLVLSQIFLIHRKAGNIMIKKN